MDQPLKIKYMYINGLTSKPHKFIFLNVVSMRDKTLIESWKYLLIEIPSYFRVFYVDRMLQLNAFCSDLCCYAEGKSNPCSAEYLRLFLATWLNI